MIKERIKRKMKKIYLNGIEKWIKSLLENVFEKVSRQKVKVIVHFANSTKI